MISFHRNIGDYVDCIYPIGFKIKDITNASRYISFLYLRIPIVNTHDINSHGQLRTKFNNKTDEFNFLIVNFPFLSM